VTKKAQERVDQGKYTDLPAKWAAGSHSASTTKSSQHRKHPKKPSDEEC
jgi:hypothetical protein